VLAIVALVAVERVARVLRVDVLLAVLGWRWLIVLVAVVRRRWAIIVLATHPACAVHWAQATPPTTARGYTAKHEQEGDNNNDDDCSEHPSPPKVPVRVWVASAAALIISRWTISLRQMGELLSRSHGEMQCVSLRYSQFWWNCR
jgi:hypothetical protein